MEIFKLVGSIMVDSTAANESLSKTDKNAESVGNKLANGVKTAAKWGTAIVAGATAAGTAIYGMATKTAANADEIDKMSQKIGISREAYQELDFVMSQNGMDVNKLQTGMKTLRSQMDSAATGAGSASENFSKLGISVKNADGSMRAGEDVFMDTIAALQNMNDETQRNVIAAELFGKSATEMLPLLNSGAGSMKELTQKAHDLGMVLGDDVVDSGVVLTDTIDAMKRSLEAAANNLGGAVMPIVTQACQFITDNMPTITGMVETLTPVITELGAAILPPLMPLVSEVLPLLSQLISAILPTVSTLISALLPVIIQLLTMLLPPMVEIVNQILPPLLELLVPIMDLLGPIIELLNPILELVLELMPPLIKLAVSILTPLISVITKLISVAITPLNNILKVVASTVSGVLTTAFQNLQKPIDNIRTVFSNLLGFVKNTFTGDWKAAWNNVKTIFTTIASGIGSAFKAPINFIIGSINGFIRGLNKIEIPDWVPAVGGKGFHIKEIPKLAEGGVLERGQTGFLEGNGAEAVVPLENNSKWISKVAEDMDTAMGGNNVEALLAELIDAVNDVRSMGLYLDGKRLVGGLTEDMNTAMGRLQAQKARA